MHGHTISIVQSWLSTVALQPAHIVELHLFIDCLFFSFLLVVVFFKGWGPITDCNEIVYHFLECIYVHVHNTKLRATSVAADAQPVPSVNGTPLRGYQGTQHNQFSGQFGELKGLDQMVMDYLQQPVNLAKEKGVHVGELVQRLNIPLEKIMSSIKALEDEGLVYSTIDEEHYKSTGNA
ncbi:hypothetical protein Cgig2_024174 [Carnegiea gigantea]|uniref:Replication protein A C-terminal domain-containing protein n=1 Tax=Carnegiea gigantea TaxID=171969 RepID=A0A9Q1QEW3_9CARY|nr:hypothetical protein Cgig2_024174 [Carnegiea gigantea]